MDIIIANLFEKILSLLTESDTSNQTLPIFYHPVYSLY